MEFEKVAFEKIKVVIWDLDDTFWKGTLSEGPIQEVSENIQLIHDLTDMGIVNTICSKNDMEPAMAQLEKLGIADEIVFPSINWEPKGQRIQKLLTEMKLREENALFLDDNPMNLQEALYYNKKLMVATPDKIREVVTWVATAEKKDEKHTRLQNYKLLEEKKEEQSKCSSNEEFLRASNIKVEICRDWEKELDRIAELVLRTNQLNYTKLRSNRDELVRLCQDENTDAGYVTVRDRFGEYGIVGFFAYKKKEQECVHFLFSCRTLGMGIEQYVYAALGYPKLTVEGEVAAKVIKGQCPDWINQEREEETVGRQSVQTGEGNHKVLLKGPCDLNAIFPFIEENEAIDSEFTYVCEKTGVSIEQINHSSHIVQAGRLSKEQIETLCKELPFADEKMYSDAIYRYDYDIVFLSVLADANLGMYRRKETGEVVAFTDGYYPLTDEKNWDGYISGKYYAAHCRLTKEFLQEFKEKYEFVGVLSPEQILENLKFIREKLADHTKMVVLLGTETYYEKNTHPGWENRHVIHKQINDLVKKYASEKENVDYIDVNQYITGQESFYDHFNHFIVPVYYEMSKEIVKRINDAAGCGVREKDAGFVKKSYWKQKLLHILDYLPF